MGHDALTGVPQCVFDDFVLELPDFHFVDTTFELVPETCGVQGNLEMNWNVITNCLQACADSEPAWLASESGALDPGAPSMPLPCPLL